MTEHTAAGAWDIVTATVKRWLSSTPRRTFVLFPLAVIVLEFAVYGQLSVVFWAAILMVWGFLQYRLTGRYRHGIAGGTHGMRDGNLPPRLVIEGPYRYTRNPMYLGHLIFLLGLTITLKSWFALAILIVCAVWFDRRVREDEARLAAQFGAEYTAYRASVKRWIPYIY